jgi:PKD repeat protein
MVASDTSSIYHVWALDANGCKSYDTASIYVNTYPKLSVFLVDTLEICSGDSTTATAVPTGGNGQYVYLWSNNQYTQTDHFNPSTSTSYFLTLADNCGTPAVKDSVFVGVHPIPYVSYISKKDSCEPLGMVFIPTPVLNNVTYEWNFGDALSGNNVSTQMYPSHVYNYPGTYDVSVSMVSEYGCEATRTFPDWITVHSLPVADFNVSPNPASLFDNVVTFYNATESADEIAYSIWNINNEAFNYDDIDDQPKVTFNQPGYYPAMLVVQTIYQCRDTMIRFVRVNDEYTLYVPDAFTPGEDGRNDYFYPMGHGLDSAKTYEFVIYDRWGMEIYKTNHMPKGTLYRTHEVSFTDPETDETGWNGRYLNTGEYVQNDVYIWRVKVVDVNGVPHEASGTVNVIR